MPINLKIDIDTHKIRIYFSDTTKSQIFLEPLKALETYFERKFGQSTDAKSIFAHSEKNDGGETVKIKAYACTHYSFVWFKNENGTAKLEFWLPLSTYKDDDLNTLLNEMMMPLGLKTESEQDVKTFSIQKLPPRNYVTVFESDVEFPKLLTFVKTFIMTAENIQREKAVLNSPNNMKLSLSRPIPSRLRGLGIFSANYQQSQTSTHSSLLNTSSTIEFQLNK